MPRYELTYPKGDRNTVNRYKHQATYSLRTIHSIINTSAVLHVSFQPSPTDPFPVILPLIGQMGSYARPSADEGEVLECYLHGYVSSRIMNLCRTQPAATDEAMAVASSPDGLPVCIAAAKVDGLVLSLTPNSHNYNYRSAILFGHATLVSAADEKQWAMELITNSVVAGRWTQTRVPPNSAEMASTQILKVVVDSGSAKVREGVPTDDVADLENGELLDRVWTGVLPVYEQFGDPVPGPYNRLQVVPEHVRLYKEGLNKLNREYAEAAARKDAPVKRMSPGEDD
ncbi:flavin-nucleotide-binding protein [Phlyctema vagabunda]|uniref:Flavin-nucleotide-binding protein n=1 Tax=Phlyctema vagabunda TaxID=108571 RepID=A0ABR4PJ54_9HELO